MYVSVCIIWYNGRIPLVFYFRFHPLCFFPGHADYYTEPLWYTLLIDRISSRGRCKCAVTAIIYSMGVLIAKISDCHELFMSKRCQIQNNTNGRMKFYPKGTVLIQFCGSVPFLNVVFIPQTQPKVFVYTRLHSRNMGCGVGTDYLWMSIEAQYGAKMSTILHEVQIKLLVDL